MKRSFLLVLIALTLVGAALPSKPATIQSHQATAKNDGGVDERHPPQLIGSPFETGVLEALRAIERQQQTARNEDQSKEERWWPPSPSWAIVYITVVYVIVAIFQWTAIRRQAIFAEQSLAVVERAYIDIRLSFDFEDSKESSKEQIPNAVTCAVSNKGRTPAMATEFSYVDKVYEVIPLEPEYSPPETGDTFVAPDDPPGLFASKMGQIKSLNLSAGEWEEIKVGKRHLCVFGFVTYKDMTGGFHKTGFGWTFKADSTKPAGKPKLGRMDQPKYNYWN